MLAPVGIYLLCTGKEWIINMLPSLKGEQIVWPLYSLLTHGGGEGESIIFQINALIMLLPHSGTVMTHKLSQVHYLWYWLHTSLLSTYYFIYLSYLCKYLGIHYT